MIPGGLIFGRNFVSVTVIASYIETKILGQFVDILAILTKERILHP